MDKYKSHKVVEGFKIDRMKQNLVNGSVKLIGVSDEVEVNASYANKHNPQVGGYYVRYQDGYESFSPAEAFETGYTKVGNANARVVSIARVCHEANRAYCQAMGDDSQKPWEECPEWQRKSAIDGVMFQMANPETTPEDSHINWMTHKASDGWIYGETKDEEAKTHPCMIDYSELPAEQRAKDHIFSAIVKSMV
jgi:hypothetical protein